METLYTEKIFVLYQNDFEKDRIEKYIKKYNTTLEYELIKSISFKKDDNYIFDLKRMVNFKNIYFNKYLSYYKNYKLNKNQISHIKSIINIIEKAIENNYKSIGIIEYDIYFHKNLSNILPEYKILIHNSDITYLGSSQHNWYNHINNQKITFNKIKNNLYYDSNHSLGTFAVILKNTIFQIYLDYLKLFLFSSDIVLSIISYNYKSFVIFPNLIICDVSKSSILKKRDTTETFLKFKWNKNNYSI